VFAGIPHHITQRGNRRENVFFTDADRLSYLGWLAHYCARYGVHVLAYCLMTNHVHLVAVPGAADALEKVFRPLHTRYAQRMNRAQGWSGHLWQGRFFSSPLDERYLWAAIRYVERNPVRAAIVRRAESYCWSSARAHCMSSVDSVLTTDAFWTNRLGTIGDWSQWLAEPDDREQMDLMRQRVERSLPCGADVFIRELELRGGQMLQARPCGRPKRRRDER
jgi:putative transposase